MPAIQANASKFLFTTDYPVDKIVYLKSGSFTAGASTSSTESFAHGLSFTPLLGGYWSTTADFSIVYEFNTGPFPGPTPNPFSLFTDIQATSSNVQMPWVNTNGSPNTIYYRIYGFAPPGVSISVSPTVNSGDNFVLNTDYNYMKLLDENSYALGTATTGTVSHTAGDIPRVSWWVLKGGIIYPSTNTVLDTSNITLEVTSSTIVFHNPFGDNITAMYYRIYI